MLIGGIVISLAEDRKFYQEYKCEILTANQENKSLINSFKADTIGSSLEEHLKVKSEGQELGDDDLALKVHKCYSDIELRHFCKNVNYKIEKKENSFGCWIVLGDYCPADLQNNGFGRL